MSSHSSGVSLPGLSSTMFGTPSFPRSCRSPARRRSRSSAASRPRIAPIPAAVSATRSEWREVNGDLASTTRPKASAMRSRRSSSARTTCSGGSNAATWAVTSGAATRCQNAESRGDVLEEPHERRVEPGAATAANDVCGRLRPAGREEDLRRLRQPDEPAEQRDLLAAQAGRLASPVPVLVGRGHRDHGRVGEGQELEDLGAAIAAQPDELVAEARAAPRDGRHPARPARAANRTSIRRCAAPPRSGGSSRSASGRP